METNYHTKQFEYTSDQIDKWETNASIHTVAFVGFAGLSFFYATGLWVWLTLALTIWNGIKATSCWNTITLLKQENEVNRQMMEVEKHWYNQDGTMKQERIDEALERLNKENKE